ncbi:MAG: TonB-dependent receptor [Deltaproteobacteria bacterium]|nr:TonB-dependent receptor [Deltaproteobacteria bacterium]MCL5276251.1 TonB-dependent receptor [Deltaproteobacteria bacterium]
MGLRITISICLIVAAAGNALASQRLISFQFFHKPIVSVKQGGPITVSATIDPANEVAYASVLYKAPADKFYRAAFLKKGSGDVFVGTIPAEYVVPPKIQYYITVMDTDGQTHLLFMGPDNPQGIDVGKGNIKSAEESAALEQELALFSSEDIVYSAAKHAQKAKESPSSISVITGRMIEDSGALSITDVLRTVPGLDVLQVNPSYDVVSARGYAYESNTTMLVLIDGMAADVELADLPFYELFPVPLEDIDRIEVIRGPGSALYGADAYSGVINITTKSPKDMKEGYVKVEPGFYTDQTTTDPATFYLTGLAAGHSGELSYLVSANTTKVAHWYNSELPALDDRKADMTFVYSPKEDRTLTLNFFDLSGTGVAFSTFGNILFDADEYNARMDWNAMPWRFTLYWVGMDTTVNFHMPGIPSQFTNLVSSVSGNTNTYDFNGQYTLVTGDVNRLIVGAEGLANVYSVPILTEPHTQEYRVSGYMQDEIRPVPPLIVTIGARYDYNSVTKPALSPRAAIVYDIDRANTIRLSVARAFRKPSFLEYGFQIASLAPYGFRIGNRSLDNEYVTDYELGYIVKPAKPLKITADLFYEQFRNYIDFDMTSEEYTTTTNGSNSMGGELEVEYAPVDQFSLFANYAYLIAQPLGSYSYDLSAVFPKHKINGGFTLRLFDRLTLMMWADFVSQTKRTIVNPNTTNILLQQEEQFTIDPYTTVNGQLKCAFVKNMFEAGVSFFNLFNDVHYEFPGIMWTQNNPYGAPEAFGGEEIGRRIMGWVSVKF